MEEKRPDMLNSVAIVPVKDVIVFPQMIAPILVSREVSINALDNAIKNEINDIILLAQKDASKEHPDSEDLYSYGILSKIIQVLKFPDGNIKIIVEGIARIKIEEFNDNDSILYAKCREVEEISHDDIDSKALAKLAMNKFEHYIRKNSKLSSENIFTLTGLSGEPGRLADIMATYLDMEANEKQIVLETLDTKSRLEFMSGILERELEILEIEEKINDKLKKNLAKTQKEIFLKEKIRAIREELREGNESESEFAEYKRKLETLNIPDKYKKKVYKEITRLEEQSPHSMDSSYSKNYIERVLELPWNESTTDNLDIHNALNVLNEDHYGLIEEKNRIIEFLAVKQLTKKKQATILCFVGPPGVGKTSLAKSIARSLNRKFSYISLGGINDESEIRGHRKTYVGSMPGKIIQAIETAETKNPVILLDELEKMVRSHMGDPTAALLEVLDPEQNSNFTDHYINIPFDLSDVFFVATANSIDKVYKALRDRLEVIYVSGYTEEEKIRIALDFLAPKQLDLHGLKKSNLSFNEAIIKKIILEYTKEAGVRSLERNIARICRKTATEMVKFQKKKISLTQKNLEKFLGAPKYKSDDKRIKPETGVINGLAWTESGGELLTIETCLMPGKGKLKLTGSLGNVMKESAETALGYLRSHHKKYGISQDIQDKYDLHIHVPEGAIPKDGPSAGLAIALSLLSTFTNKPIKANVALTGEITLRGRVLPIGGVKEKVLAALRNDINKVIIPENNRKDVDELPEYLKDKMDFVYIKSLDEAMKHVYK